MEATVYLRQAGLLDLVRDGKLIENRVFFYKSMQTGMFCGPYEIPTPDDDIQHVCYQILLGMIYVAHFEPVPGGVACSMKFNKAEGTDMKYKNELKVDFSYWLKIDFTFVGPFVLTDKTNVLDLALQLKEERVFVLAHKSVQAFPELNKIQKAS